MITESQNWREPLELLARGTLKRLKKRVPENLNKFNNAKCKTGEEGLESSSEEMDMEVLMDERLDMSQTCILGYIKSEVASRVKEVIVPL